MQTLFVSCLLVGALVLALQIVLGFLGVDTDAPDLAAPDLDVPDLDAAGVDLPHGGAGHMSGGVAHHGELVEGLDLLSVRSLAAGTAMFGAAGLGFASFLPPFLALPAALLPAFCAMLGTAWLTRMMLRMESSGSLLLEGAVGSDATVYLTVPGGSLVEGSMGADHGGLVHVSLQGRTVELRAVTREGTDLPTGSSVVVIAVREDGETVEVVPPSTLVP